MSITALANFVFTDGRSNEWTENLYIQGTDIRACRVSQLAIANNRIALLQPGFKMIEGRVSDVAIFKDSLLLGPADLDNGGVGNYPQVVSVPEEPELSGEPAYVRLLLRMEASSLYRRPYWMGGLPEDIVDQQGTYTPTRAWTNRFLGWVTSVLAVGYLRRKKGATVPAPDGGQMPQRLPINNLATPDPDTQAPLSVRLSFLTPPATLPITAGQQIRIGKSRNTRNLNGLWRVNSIVPATIGNVSASFVHLDARRYPVEASLDGTSSNFGYATPINSTFASPFFQLSSVIPEKGIRRKTGGPFQRSPGRGTTQH